MLKVKDLLLLLPEDVAFKALTNFRTQRNDRFHTLEADRISEAITYAFNWNATSEGDFFWRQLYTQYQELENKELTTDGKIIIKLENQENQETK